MRKRRFVPTRKLLSTPEELHGAIWSLVAKHHRSIDSASLQAFYWYYSFFIDVEMDGFGKYMRVVVERDCDRLNKTRAALRYFGLDALLDLHEGAVRMSVKYFQSALKILRAVECGKWKSPLPQLLKDEEELNRKFGSRYHDSLAHVAEYISKHRDEFIVEYRESGK